MPLSLQADDALLRAELGDLRGRPDVEAVLATADLVPALDQHHAELAALGLEHVREHDQIALLEHPQSQRHVREQHGPEWKHRQGRHADQPTTRSAEHWWPAPPPSLKAARGSEPKWAVTEHRSDCRVSSDTAPGAWREPPQPQESRRRRAERTPSMATIDILQLRIDVDAVGPNPRDNLTVSYTAHWDAYDGPRARPTSRSGHLGRRRRAG